MKNIPAFDKLLNERPIKTSGINPTLFWAYKEAQDTGNEDINFSEVIWDEDIAEIAKALRLLDIRCFTISSTFSGLIPTLAKFEEQGFKLAGLTEVKARYDDWLTGEKAILPAIRLVDKNS